MCANQAIEIAPRAYMRGRTLNHAFVILDEAQNTTPEQMKMFLTRIGFGSKAVVTGDITQIDLQRHQRSGLIDAVDILEEVRGIAFCSFSSADVVRHPLVARIVDAYEASGEPLSDANATNGKYGQNGKNGTRGQANAGNGKAGSGKDKDGAGGASPAKPARKRARATPVSTGGDEIDK